YSSMSFSAYFKVRVLFWSHKWQKTLANTRIFQREVDYQLAPGFPDIDLCSFVGDNPDGTCADPNARCDATGECVRYDFVNGPSAPEEHRVELGECSFFDPPPAPLSCVGVPASMKTLLQGNTCYLTFDDGPHSTYTPTVLDTLRNRGVHATFFLTGTQIAGR